MAGARVTLAPMRPALVLAENRLAGREQPCGIDRMILVYRNRRAFALIEWADPDIVCRCATIFDGKAGVDALFANRLDHFADRVRPLGIRPRVFLSFKPDRARTG